MGTTLRHAWGQIKQKKNNKRYKYYLNDKAAKCQSYWMKYEIQLG
jgi:hypothetical protein